jgi:uncharacterized protein
MSSFDTSPKPKVAVITGGHPFDVPAFRDLFLGMDRIEAYVQHMEDWVADAARIRSRYDALVFYHMFRDAPDDATRQALEGLGKADQGTVVLHHALLSYPEWDLWTDLTGLPSRDKFTFDLDQSLETQVVVSDHPITKGLSSWHMIDETYQTEEPIEGSTVLLTTDHPKSMHALAWTRSIGNARVFCYQSGHDERTWGEPCFRHTLLEGILWSTGKLWP